MDVVDEEGTREKCLAYKQGAGGVPDLHESMTIRNCGSARSAAPLPWIRNGQWPRPAPSRRHPDFPFHPATACS